MLPAGAAIQSITAVRTGKLAAFRRLLDLSTDSEMYKLETQDSVLS